MSGPGQGPDRCAVQSKLNWSPHLKNGEIERTGAGVAKAQSSRADASHLCDCSPCLKVFFLSFFQVLGVQERKDNSFWNKTPLGNNFTIGHTQPGTWLGGGTSNISLECLGGC